MEGLAVSHFEVVSQELLREVEKVRRPAEAQLLAKADQAEELLEEVDGRRDRQRASLNIETHEFNRLFELLAQVAHFGEETLLQKHGHNFGVACLPIAVDFQHQFVVESDAAHPDVEALSHDLSVLLTDCRLFAQDQSQRCLQQVLKLAQVNSLKKLGRCASLIIGEHLREPLIVVCDGDLLGDEVVLRLLNGLRMHSFYEVVVSHAYLALQAAREVAVFSLGAEAGNEDHFYQIGCETQCARF